jgi:hypothetical protein
LAESVERRQCAAFLCVVRIGYDEGMKLPQFSLRFLFVAMTILAIPLAWMTYSLNWIRKRHDLLRSSQSYDNPAKNPAGKPFPFSLKVFGEQPHTYVLSPPERIDEAKELFPESKIYMNKGNPRKKIPTVPTTKNFQN